jgi:phosphoglycerate dehydrogenase-like enzyme
METSVAGTTETIIAHHLPEGIARQLEPRLPAGASLVRTPEETPWTIPGQATVMICMPPHAGVHYPEEAPEGWPFGLQWVQTVSTGIEDYPRWVFEVENATCGRGTQSDAIAEFVLASMLALEKRFPEVWLQAPDGWKEWQSRPLDTIEGKTIGLIGFGTIGKAIALRAQPFGARILATRRSGPGSEDGVTFGTLDQVLAEADHLVLAAPLTEETRHIIRRETLAKLKQDAHLVNVSRGGMVDQEALIEALDSGHLRFATLDVTDPEPLPPGHPLYTHPKVRVSPHVSWGKGGNPFDAIGGMIVENIRRFQQGQALLNPIDREAGY